MRQKKINLLSGIAVILILCCLGCTQNKNKLPGILDDYIASVEVGQLQNTIPDITYTEVAEGIVKVIVTFDLKDTLHQDDWQVKITPAFTPDFHWAPHLTPTGNHIISQHVFRSPAIVVASENKKLTVIPNLDFLQELPPVKWYMDVNAPENSITLGMSETEVREHVLFVRQPGAAFHPGKTEFSFYILATDKKEDLSNPFRNAAAFIWENWGSEAYHERAAASDDLEKYVEHTYNWAFNTWKDNVWQEFKLNGKDVGAPVFIVNTTQSPNHLGEINEREFRSVWNQAWFNSLRSASGLYRYGRRTGNRELQDYALKTKELALQFPQEKGFFPGLIATEMHQVEIDGENYNRSKGWETLYFGNSNRNPYTWNPADAPYHILDMSFTANQMVLWYSELEQDSRLIDFAVNYADALVEIQSDDGFYPAWLDSENLQPLKHLNDSPESSMSVTFLLNLFKITNNEKYRASAIKAMNAIIERIVPQGRWEDFETYWSCSRYGAENLVGNKVERNNQFKQNTLSMFWTAEALLNTFRQTGKEEYLKWGQRTLDEMLMYQASWQPPFIYVRAVGGFGVMNADGEWNDSRQSLFSELILQYGEALSMNEYTERGLAALYASFEMMYCPENEETKEQWEKAWPFFDETDYGFMMENYGHGGVTSPDGIGIGEFTIYDWGNGAASEAWNRIADKHVSLLKVK